MTSVPGRPRRLHPQSLRALELAADQPSVAAPGFDADGVRCRLLVPEHAVRTCVYLHGGGFVLGDLDTHDAQARRLAVRTGSAVLSVDYRRPPEHRFPAAPDDVTTALGWWHRHAGDHGLDPARTVAVGDSAGANLALVAALREPGTLAALVLVYPFLDPTTSRASYGLADGGLTRDEANWYWWQYARGPADLTDPDLAPLRSPRLATLPPTLVQIAGCDVLVDEDTELVRLLEAAGVEVRATTYDGMVHGFWRHPELFDDAELALEEVAAFLHIHV